MILWLKVGGILGAVLLVFGGGWYCGGLRSRNEMETAQAQQLGQLVKEQQDLTLKLQTSEAARQKAVDAYDAIKDLPDPIVGGLAQRVRVVETATSCAMSSSPSAAGGADAPAAQPPGDDRARAIVAANQAVYDSCEQDARQLNGLEAWVRAR